MININEKLRNSAVRHQLDLIRHAESIYEQLSLLKALEEDIKSVIANRLDAIKTRGLSSLPLQRSKDLLKWIQNKTKELNAQFNDELKQPLRDVAEYEIDYQKNSIKSTIGETIPDQVAFNFELVNPPRNLIAAIVSSNPLGGRLMTEYTSKWSTNLRDNLSANVRLGMVQGQTTENIVRRLIPVLDASRAGVRAIVHTTVSGVASQARDYLFAQNKDTLKGIQWVSTLDSKTTEICRGLDGQVFPLNSGPRPPAHFNAVPYFSTITTEKGKVNISDIKVGVRVLTHKGRFKPVLAVMKKKRPDKGRLVRLIMHPHIIFFSSEEHPVLTANRGWVRAGEMRIGDEIYARTDSLPEAPIDPSSWPKCFDHYELFDEIEKQPTKNFVKKRSVNKSLDCRWGNPSVVSISRIAYDDAMYNLSVEEDETYVSDGIIVANCRSTMVPVTKSWKELGIDLNELPVGERPTVRDGLAGKIAANKTYGDWLATQDEAFQREILGDKKYELFAKGKLTLDKFVDIDRLKPLTLDEIKANEPTAWKRAGLNE